MIFICNASWLSLYTVLPCYGLWLKLVSKSTLGWVVEFLLGYRVNDFIVVGDALLAEENLFSSVLASTDLTFSGSL